MMYFIKILFLSISVLFSFGFTTYESNCNAQTHEKIESAKNHSCCHSEIEVTTCTKSKDCKAGCCLIQSNFFVLNDFVFTTESIEKVRIIEIIKQVKTVYKQDNYSLKNYADKIDNYHYLDSKYSGKQIISLKQSWLI